MYDRELGEIARKSLRQAVTERAKPPLGRVLRVYVRCYRDRESFERTFERRFGVPAGQVIAYYAGGGDVHLRGGTCAGVHAFLGGRQTVSPRPRTRCSCTSRCTGRGSATSGTRTASRTTPSAGGRRVARLRPERALRARDLAFAFSRRYAPPAYHIGMPDCLALVGRADWVDHV